MIISVYLHPGSRQSKCEKKTDLFGNDCYHIRIPEKPQDNQANDALILFLSQYFSRPKTAIAIISGFKSRHKKISIDGVG